jgi:hypothetical protein
LFLCSDDDLAVEGGRLAEVGEFVTSTIPRTTGPIITPARM